MPKALWEKLGKWLDIYGVWAHGEIGLSLAARFAGIPVFCYTKSYAEHLFRKHKDKPYSDTNEDKYRNLAGMLYCLFGDDIWFPHIRPTVSTLVKTAGWIDWLENDPETTKKRAHLASIKVRSDEEIFSELVEANPKKKSKARILNSKEPKITCLCPTYGRFSLLRESLTWFLTQTYKNKELIILNDAPVKIECGIPGVRVVNVSSQPTLGHKRKLLLELAASDLVTHWDDDDIYLPFFLEQAVKNYSGGCIKPEKAWYAVRNGNEISVKRSMTNNFEGMMTFSKKEALALGGYSMKHSGQALTLLQAFRRMNRYKEYTPEPGWSYIYCFRRNYSHISAARKQKRYIKGNKDFGTGKLLPVKDLSHYLKQLRKFDPHA
jgi:hypothetical protein